MIYFNCKEDIALEDLKVLQPALWILITRSMLYCAEFNLPFKITSIISDRKGIKSKSYHIISQLLYSHSTKVAKF